MSPTISHLFLAASLTLAPFACGGSQASSEYPAEHHDEHQGGPHEHGGGPHEHGDHEHGEHEHEHGGHEHGDHHDMPAGPLHDLHEVLGPRWHAEKGPEREKSTCSAVPEMKKHAVALEASPPAGGAEDAAAWKKDAGALTASLGALETECAKPEGSRPDFEARFAAVHDAFHGMMKHTKAH